MMNLRIAGFDWDDGNRANCQKQCISIADNEAVFALGVASRPVRGIRLKKTA
jgi:uncharacterized DUF497 family protein